MPNCSSCCTSLCSSAQELLSEYGPSIGLNYPFAPFPSSGSMRSRLQSNPYLMAPMAGVSNACWRMLARAGGAALAYSEMVSVAGLHYQSDKTWELVLPDDAEPDIAVQLFGSKPEQFLEAARLIRRRLGDKLALIDINMACPVPKVTRKGEGSALLDEPERATSIVKACIAGVDAEVPVTVKIRIGRTPDKIVGPSFARSMQDAGAHAIAVHGRVASQMYRGKSSVEAIADVVRSVDIPVIASGDVLSEEAALKLQQATRCDAVFIARGSYGDPWIFSRCHAIDQAKTSAQPSIMQRLDCFELHVRMLHATHAHLARARSLAGWYLKGVPGATRLRSDAFMCSTLDDYLRFCENTRNMLVSAGV